MTDELEVLHFLTMLLVLTFYTKLPFGAIADDGIHMMFSFLLGKTLFFIFISSFFYSSCVPDTKHTSTFASFITFKIDKNPGLEDKKER
jgi:hypothetical protein